MNVYFGIEYILIFVILRTIIDENRLVKVFIDIFCHYALIFRLHRDPVIFEIGPFKFTENYENENCELCSNRTGKTENYEVY